MLKPKIGKTEYSKNVDTGTERILPTMTETSTEPLIVEREGSVGILQLHRPKVLNALNPELMAQLATAAESFDEDPEIKSIVILGSERAFAAGADIADMAPRSVAEMKQRDQFRDWDRLRRVRTPIIAGVSGFALGGGCELAMLCDLAVAADNAKFGQPEVSIGVIPGAGGTRRLARSVGRAVAMDLCLTGRMLDAEEALRIGLVSRVLPTEGFAEAVKNIGREIAKQAPLAVRLAKEAVNAAFETPLEGGIQAERNLFFSCFGTEDQKEGMQAFLEKRKPNWNNC